MNIINKKKSLGILFLGWILIVYFLYFFLYPLAVSISSTISDSSDTYAAKNPIGSFSLLLHLDVPKILPYLHMVIFLGITIAIPICNLIAGILILRLNKKGRKCAIASLSGDLILRILFLFTLINTYIRDMCIADSNPSTTILFCSIILFDILLIYSLTSQKIKSAFANA